MFKILEGQRTSYKLQTTISIKIICLNDSNGENESNWQKIGENESNLLFLAKYLTLEMG